MRQANKHPLVTNDLVTRVQSQKGFKPAIMKSPIPLAVHLISLYIFCRRNRNNRTEHVQRLQVAA